MPAAAEGLTGLARAQRIASGLLLLLAVDVIWVASSELTSYIFKDLNYDKPFFSTYAKTALFSIYLAGFVVYKPWRREVAADTSSFAWPWAGRNRARGYDRVRSSDDDDEEEARPLHARNDSHTDDEDSGHSHDDEGVATASSSASTSSSSRSVPVSVARRALSSPMFVPVNIPDSGKSSGTEDDDESAAGGASSIASSKRVRFDRVAQVVEMNPADALYANLARLSYSASLRAQAALRRAAQRLTPKQVASVALMFCVPWFVGNYAYQQALSHTETAVVNVLSASSCLFTLVLSAVFPSDDGDRLTLSKLVAVVLSLAGVAIVSFADMQSSASPSGLSLPSGALWSLGGALCYSLYIVLLRRKVHNEENMDAPMFFGFVGLFCGLFLWPGLLVLHASGEESFEWPSPIQWQWLILNGLIGTVLSELLWLWGCFYTSSVVATMAISLTIPLSVLADVVWKHRTFAPLFFVGAVPMFCSFFVVALLTHYEGWDPLMELALRVAAAAKRVCGCASANAVVVNAAEGAEAANDVFEADDSRALLRQPQSSREEAM